MKARKIIRSILAKERPTVVNERYPLLRLVVMEVLVVAIRVANPCVKNHNSSCYLRAFDR